MEKPSGGAKHASWNHSDNPALYRNIERRAGKFGWKRTVRGKRSSKQGFSSIELARRDMCSFYNEPYSDASGAEDAGAGDAGAAGAAVRSQSTIARWCALGAR